MYFCNLGKHKECQVITEINLNDYISTAQSRKEIEIRCKAATFIKTTSYNRAKNLLKEHGHVTIIGKPGSGKSSLSYHLLNEVCNGDGKYKDVIIMESAKAIKEILEERDNVAVLVEDVFGKFEISRDLLREWTSIARTVSHSVGPQSDTRQNCLVINVRKSIYDECSVSFEDTPWFWTQNTIDLDNRFLSDDEKRRMIEIHASALTKVDKDRILETSTPVVGFPQCCVVLSECLKASHQYQILEVFRNPIVPLKNELRRLQQEHPLKFLSLALVFMHGEDIKCPYSLSDSISLFLIPKYIPSNGKIDINDGIIDSAMESCCPFYIVRKDDAYHFAHNSIHDSVASCLWEDAQRFVVENCNVSFLKRVSLSSASYFKIVPSLRASLISRLRREIYLRSSLDVLSESEALQDKCLFNELLSDTSLLNARDDSGDSFARHLIRRNRCSFTAEYFVSILDKLDPAELLSSACEFTNTCLFNVLHARRVKVDLDVVYSAIKGGDQSIIKTICKIFDFEKKFDESMQSKQKQNLKTNLLQETFLSGNLETLKLFPLHMIKKNVNDLELINYATLSRSALMVKFCVENGAEVRQKCGEYGSTSLHTACSEGNLEIVNYLLNTSKDLLEIRDNEDYTPLFHAVIGGHIPVLEFLIKRGADAEATGKNGRTILHLACWKGQFDISIYIIEHFPRLLSIVNSNDVTVAHYAAVGGSIQLLEKIVEIGIEVNCVDNKDRNVIHYACREKNNKEMVTYLSNQYPDLIQQSNVYGWTALHDSVVGGSLSVVEYLICQGLDVYQRTKDNANILHLACQHSPMDLRLSFVQYLLQNFPELLKVIDKNGRTVMHYASRGGSLQIIKFIEKNDTVNKYPDLYHQTTTGDWTTLHDSVIGGSLSVVEHLIGQGLDVYQRTKDDTNILHLACQHSPMELRLSFVQYLLQNFPELLKVIDKNGRTVMHYASRGGSIQIIKFIEKNDTVNKYPDLYHQTTTDNWTTLHDSAIGGSLSVVEHLIGQGLDVYQRTKDDTNILHLACQHSPMELRLSFVQYLLQNFPELLKVIDKNGRTIMHYASRGGSLQIIKFIEKNDTVNKYPDLYHQITTDGWTTLHDSVKGGSISVVEHLIGQNLDVYTRTKDDANILHLACQHTPMESRLSFVQYLLQNFPELSKDIDKKGRTVMHYAAIGGSLHIIKLLEEKDFRIEDKDNEGYNSLHLACGFCTDVNNVEAISNMINKMPDFQDVESAAGLRVVHCAASSGYVPLMEYLEEMKVDMSVRDGAGCTVLYRACIGGKGDMARYLSQKYPDQIEIKDFEGVSILHAAARSFNLDLVKYLINIHPDMYVKDHNGISFLDRGLLSPNNDIPDSKKLTMVKYLVEEYPALLSQYSLICAAVGGSVKVLEYLINIPSLDIDTKDRENNILQKVCWAGREEEIVNMVDYLATRYPQFINMPGEFNKTTLHYAAEGGNVTVFKYLLEKGMNVYGVDNRGWTVLHYAAGKYHNRKIDQETIVKYLLENYPDLIEKSKGTPTSVIHCAVNGGSVGVLQLLSPYFDIFDKIHDGSTVLHIAAERQHLNLVCHLAEHYPSLINELDHDGRTAVMRAADNRPYKVVTDIARHLVDRGCYMKYVSNSGDTAMSIARRRKNERLVAFLRKHKT